MRNFIKSMTTCYTSGRLVPERSEAERRGYNFMEWKVSGTKGVIVYRNLVTDPT